jgi:ABC-2 type transport system ATP-binding protein
VCIARHLFLPSEAVPRILSPLFILAPLGQRMRGDLAAALLHEPDVLYLDEPAIGLDVVAKARVREFLAAINRERAVTVLLTTHDIDGIGHLCRGMIILDAGHILFDGPLDRIARRFGAHRTLVVDVDGAEGCLEVPGAVWQRSEGCRHWLAFDGGAITASALIARVAERYRLLDLTVQEPAIEDVVRRIYEEGTV